MEPESWKGADTTQYNKYTPTAIIEQNGLFAYGYIGVWSFSKKRSCAECLLNPLRLGMLIPYPSLSDKEGIGCHLYRKQNATLTEEIGSDSDLMDLVSILKRDSLRKNKWEGCKGLLI